MERKLFASFEIEINHFDFNVHGYWSLGKFGNELEVGAMTLRYMIILTVILTIAFLYLFIKYRKK